MLTLPSLIAHPHGAAVGLRTPWISASETSGNTAPLQLPPENATLPRRRASLVAGLEPKHLWPIFTH
ncbi:hypothetical protein BTW15_06960 [Pseudomonas syringae pv. tomato]|uniref:Uncharacterized protein n=3 Tax=Pseudomonas syringae group genomosp. 3 TaxID=251701 RepID=Q87XJ4_PSESM|nr:hypothetical protein PSPTO_4184 [Pseudomonas syringae pv. tomato str. DC3000]MBW8024798.1 hypothetical protein [Pseudomonas syringae pv. tomato]MCF5241201.1 hypothetical protein [Pseudomonas syringae]RMM01541.1 hypothetical protein APX70_04587 [Pseudomonas syringae pv. maculicola]OPE60864.1 hypothetical protein BTW15_06960 [Pseudomonas syringae pv. tomato]